ncbi:hypothetical protein GSI_10970 [Ganoderma sinense ZZ0214-1]|uniref:Uncharacterized protein n=1 Tax=Ganoderma sinense ZZ0214-1 TaxID=1077348 RepID=A0A2G8S224_9APHY|nr:hypothetical protein GSI_10970 [Ganoderma sinense ZZ0214-1]
MASTSAASTSTTAIPDPQEPIDGLSHAATSRTHGASTSEGAGEFNALQGPPKGDNEIVDTGGLGNRSVSGSESNSKGAADSAAAIVQKRHKCLSDLLSLVDQMCKSMPNNMKLTFETMSTSLEDPAPEPSTPGFATLYTWLEDQIRYISQDLPPIGHRDMDQRRLALLRRLTSELERLKTLKETAWSRQLAAHIIRTHMRDADGNGPVVVEQEVARGVSYASTLEHYVLAALLMVIVLHSLAATATVTSVTPEQQSILSTIPLDVATIIEKLELEPDVVRFACCPTCRFTYAPDPKRPNDPYPHICTNQEIDKPVCGTALVYPQEHSLKHSKGTATVTYEPFIVFPFRSPISWLADFISRPGMLALLRTSWDRKDSPTGAGQNILSFDGIRSFLGPDKKTPFSSQPDGSLHLVFSLFVDWFNPFGNKKAGKSHSIGVICLALQNLPEHLRYQAENMCLVGVIPGPHEPELHQLNHFLRPLVDELLALWHRGMHLTVPNVDGVLLFIHTVLIPLVCDIPALRKTGGFAGHMSSHFCSFCELPKADINELDRKKWLRHDWKQHVHYATRWRDAKTEAGREAEFKAHGIRWSKLLRLEYWDPTKFSVIDVMHNLFLGELRHHCREVWGLDIKDKGGDGPILDPHTPEQQRVQLERVRSALIGGHRNPLDKVRKGYIVAVAQLNGVKSLDGSPAKKAYVDALLLWAKSNPTILLPPVLAEPTTDFHAPDVARELLKFRVIDRETIEHIRGDIAATSFPSWMERPPRNFGSPSHGKLKADQWRVVCTLFGPVHGWWTFPFERFNGLLQRLNTNSKPNQMPLTFMKYFYIGATLRWFVTSYQWPNTSVFTHMVNSFRQAFSSISSGSCINDFIPFGATSCQPCMEDYDEDKEKQLPRTVYTELLALVSSTVTPFSSTYGSDQGHPILNDRVNFVPRVEHGGMTFSTRRLGKRDSFIIFEQLELARGLQMFPCAGQIIDLFLHVRSEHGQPVVEYFAVVEEYTPLSDLDAAQDPYRRFSDLQTRLFYRRSRPSPRVIRLGSIQAHFAALFYKPDEIAEECVVVRSLDRN